MQRMKEVAQLQESYTRLKLSNKLSKKAICDLCIPFRDKYNLTDSQTLLIARNEISLTSIIRMIAAEEENLQVKIILDDGRVDRVRTNSRTPIRVEVIPVDSDYDDYEKLKEYAEEISKDEGLSDCDFHSVHFSDE